MIKKLFAMVLSASMLLGTAECFAQMNLSSASTNVGEAFSVRGVTDKLTRNLQKLCKVWGFAKYTHPVFLLGEKDWDEELLNLIPIIKTADEIEVNDILCDWFAGLGDDGYDKSNLICEDEKQQVTLAPGFVEAESLNEPEPEERVMADTDWISDESYLGKELAAILSRFNGISITDRERAPVSFDLIGNSVFSNENKYSYSMDYNDEGYRLLGLFRLWNAIEYYFPYRDILDEDWNELLAEFIPKMSEGTDMLSYQMTLASLSNRLHDAHIIFTYGKAYVNFVNTFGRYFVPVLLAETSGCLAIKEVASNYDCALIPGDILLTYNGKDMNDAAADILQYLSYPDDERALEYFSSLGSILISHTEEVEITVLRGDEELKLTVTAYYPSIPFDFTDNRDSMQTHERLENNIGLINPAKLEPNQIHDIMAEFADTDGLIIDLRQYPEDYAMIYYLPEYLSEESRHFVTMTHPMPTVPGRFVDYFQGYSGGMSGMFNTDTYSYDKQVVLLMDMSTISRAEFTIMSLRNGSNVTVIGRNSIGADGNVTHLPLPGKLEMRYTGLGVYTPEGGQTQRIGLSPDIYVERTLEDIKEGNDELMEAAIKFILEQQP